MWIKGWEKGLGRPRTNGGPNRKVTEGSRRKTSGQGQGGEEGAQARAARVMGTLTTAAASDPPEIHDPPHAFLFTQGGWKIRDPFHRSVGTGRVESRQSVSVGHPCAMSSQPVSRDPSLSGGRNSRSPPAHPRPQVCRQG